MRRSGAIKTRDRGYSGGELLIGMAAAQLAGQDFLVGLDRQRADVAGQELASVPGLAATTAAGLARKFTDGQWHAVETGIGDIGAAMLAALPRVVEYDVPDRTGNGTGELIAVLSNILDPAHARADELAAAYHQRWEEETSNDQLKTHLRGRGRSCGRDCPSWSTRRSGRGCWSATPCPRWPPGGARH